MEWSGRVSKCLVFVRYVPEILGLVRSCNGMISGALHRFLYLSFDASQMMVNVDPDIQNFKLSIMSACFS